MIRQTDLSWEHQYRPEPGGVDGYLYRLVLQGTRSEEQLLDAGLIGLNPKGLLNPERLYFTERSVEDPESQATLTNGNPHLRLLSLLLQFGCLLRLIGLAIF